MHIRPIFIEIRSKDARSTLYFGGARTLAVILGVALVGGEMAGRNGTFQPEQFGTDDAAVGLAEPSEEFLHHLVAVGLTLAVGALGLSVVEASQDDEATNGSAHHAHTSHATSETGSDEFGLPVVEAIAVGKGRHHALAATVATHEEFYGTLYTFFVRHLLSDWRVESL